VLVPSNTGIGQFRDDPAVVWRALSYVEGPPGLEEYAETGVSEEALRALIEAEERLRADFYTRAVRVG
jgi:hypothetical protein